MYSESDGRCKQAEWLDEGHVVFGRVLEEADGESMLMLSKCEAVPMLGSGSNHWPRIPIWIVECGEV